MRGFFHGVRSFGGGDGDKNPGMENTVFDGKIRKTAVFPSNHGDGFRTNAHAAVLGGIKLLAFLMNLSGKAVFHVQYQLVGHHVCMQMDKPFSLFLAANGFQRIFQQVAQHGA